MPPIPNFADFFEALWGFDPFPWQTMLVERVVKGRWPRALDLPTAAGKTACIDAAVYALACQANQPLAERTAPRRIWFVVDRRIVVDEAFERASIIAEKLEAAKDGPLKAVADRLLGLSGTKRALAVARLRGGILRDDNFGRLPSQPAVITSTVDQLGSRLLFRGYGRSNLTASIYAGLAAHDSLILLDEAHLSMPFLQTLSAIERFRRPDWAEKPISTPLSFAFLSATLPDIPWDEVFPGPVERSRALDHPVLRARMSASKPAELVAVKADAEGDDALAKMAAERAWSFIEKENKKRVAVIVNRIKTAHDTCARLRPLADSKADIVLLTGRIRPYERDQLVEKWKPFLRAASPEQPGKPIVLVSTQCIEVGADFSFDALVTESASLDALRQRFGRLNRMGIPDPALATILVREDDTKEGHSDPVYGTATAECWRLLNQHVNETTETEEKGKRRGKQKEARRFDFGIEQFEKFLSGIDPEDVRKCLAPRNEAPILLPAHLDLLCQTAPAPAIEPDIRLFLHGKERGVPEVRVVWRADFLTDNQQIWNEIAALCPPVSGEMLSMPLHRVCAWLADEASADVETTDVEGAGTAGINAGLEEVNDMGRAIRPVLIWRGRDRSSVVRRAWAIKPDDVIIVPDSYGIPEAAQSVPAETLGAEELDLWEPAQSKGRRPFAVRVNRAVLQPWLECPPLEELVSIAEDPATEGEEIKSAIDAIRQFKPTGGDTASTPPRWLLDLFDKVLDARVEDHPGGGCVLFARSRASAGAAEPDLFADDDDLVSAVGQEITLASHTALVEIAVERIASRCLSDEFLDPLRHAAHWHDVGKLDERFQLVLRQGDEIANGLGEPLAKSASMPISPGRRKAIRAAAGLPEGFRHEMLSVQVAERYLALPSSGQVEDLVLHLIASHHGHARPFAPVIPDPEPPAISGCHDGVVIALNNTERAALVVPHHLRSGIADRFWRLTRQYGWWGLAYLEATLRLADWYGSEHVADDDFSRPSASSSYGPAIVPAARFAEENLVLTGLDGANPLGFLAAVGTLLALHQRGCPQARLGWARSATWRPFITGISVVNTECLAGRLVTALRGRSVSEGVKAARKAAEKEFYDARRAVNDKLKEIKKRDLRGKDRKLAVDKEVSPLEREADRKRTAWLKVLKDSVVRPELALGKRIDCTNEEYREAAASLLNDLGAARREPLDFLAAFASDACVKEGEERVIATPFCFIEGSGRQFFLDTIGELIAQVTAGRIRSTLFERWRYSDLKLSLRWDPIEDRRYALMDGDPGDLDSRTVWMANLLAYRALALFPSAPGTSVLRTTESW